MEDIIIILDESWPGKVGFFCITMLVCSPHVDKQIKIAVKRTLKNKINNSKKNKVKELKGSSITFAIKKYFFNSLCLEELSIYTVVLNMASNSSLLKDQNLYNNLVRHLLGKIPFSNKLKTFHLIVDKCKNNKQIKIFDLEVKNDLKILLPTEARVYITHENSIENLTVQAVDMFNWGIFRKYSKNDTEWYDLFKKYIKLELYYTTEIKTAPLIPVS